MRKRITALKLSPIPVAIAAAMFFSLVGDGHDGFWSNHPMLGALISGGLLFAAGVVIVDGFIERRNARRWSAISTAAHRELGHLIDETLKVLWLAHSDPDPRAGERSSREWTPASRAGEQRPGHEAPELALRQLPVFATDLPLPDYSGPALTPVRRVQRLLNDESYVKEARRVIAGQRDAIRAAAKEWAGLMMWAEDSQRLLNTLGVFAESNLSAVEYHLAAWTAEASDPHAQIAARLWCLSDIKGRVLLNALWGTSTPYRWVLPKEAATVSLQEAFRRPDRVGRWQPPSEDQFSSLAFSPRGVLWKRTRTRNRG